MIQKFQSYSIEKLFGFSIKIIINVLIIFIILVLIIGLGKTLYSIKDLIGGDFAYGFNHIITDVLSFLVILELFRSFIEYFETKRFRLHSMMDPFIIFVVRELIVILYTGKDVGWQVIVSFAGLILVLGIVRTLAVIYTPDTSV